MASGFVERFKGKIAANTIWVGGLTNTSGGLYLRGSGLQISPRDLTGIAGRSTPTTDPGDGGALTASGITALATSSGTRILATPFLGAVKTLYADGASTSGFRKIFTGSTLITFDGTNDVLTSSAAGDISLLGLSTVRWTVTSNTGSGTLGTTT